MFQTSDRQAVGRAKRTLVGATVEGAIGLPTARLAFAVGGKTALRPDKAKRSERSQPVKPLQRIRGERKRSVTNARAVSASMLALKNWASSGPECAMAARLPISTP